MVGWCSLVIEVVRVAAAISVVHLFDQKKRTRRYSFCYFPMLVEPRLLIVPKFSGKAHVFEMVEFPRLLTIAISGRTSLTYFLGPIFSTINANVSRRFAISLVLVFLVLLLILVFACSGLGLVDCDTGSGDAVSGLVIFSV